MKRILAAAAFALAAMTASTASAADCYGAVTGPWDYFPGYSISAVAHGPDCTKAVAVIAVRDKDGNVVYHESYIVEHVMVLAGANDGAALTKSLSEWTDASSPTFATTADLPEWKQGEDMPMNGEFAFYPEEGIDRDAWTEIRAAKTPVFCYVQGMESLACITSHIDMGVFKIGVQTFPG